MKGWIVSLGHCLGVSLTLLLTSCAVNTTPSGNTQISLDSAELLGQTVASFRLTDGNEGRLRFLNGRYSIKLQKQMQVVDIPNATLVRLASAHTVGDRTVVVLEKAEPNCNFTTQLLSIRGAEILSWDFGDCRNLPSAKFTSEQAEFDFALGPRTTRFTYRESRLTRSEFVATSPNHDSASTPSEENGPRYVPSPPVSTSGRSVEVSKSPPTTSPDSQRPRTRVAPTTSSGPNPVAKPLEFPATEQKPIRIVLDK